MAKIAADVRSEAGNLRAFINQVEAEASSSHCMIFNRRHRKIRRRRTPKPVDSQ
ncbi:hypothetical protein [Sodalis sp.]|uniref:hypothetical protein n=1 Tax=Sodalis sp. (in: enterobacteria) TaxID=1898979 RepID=UPI0038734A26